jgi:hypothetical protein
MATLDMPAVVADLYRNLLMKRSGNDRLIMEYEMFDTSRALIRISAGMQTSTDMKIYLFRRIYGQDFGNETTERIIGHCRGAINRAPTPALSRLHRL